MRRFPLGIQCHVVIRLDGAQGAPCIHAPGTVSRIVSSGMAVHFTEIQRPESAARLGNLVLDHDSGPSITQAEQDFQQHVGLTPT